MIATLEQARASWQCPVSRLWASEVVQPRCRGDACPLWRWEPLSADDPKFKAAVSARVKELGGSPVYHKQAVAYVMENRESLGLPSKPTHGFCGLGGRVIA